MKNYKLHNQEYCGQTIQQIIGTDDSGVKYWIPKNRSKHKLPRVFRMGLKQHPEEAD